MVCHFSDRQHGGIQIRWAQTSDLTFGQKWNPWCTDIPWVTLAHHPIIYNPKENETVTFNVDEFFESLLQATTKVFETKRPNEKVGFLLDLMQNNMQRPFSCCIVMMVDLMQNDLKRPFSCCIIMMVDLMQNDLKRTFSCCIVIMEESHRQFRSNGRMQNNAPVFKLGQLSTNDNKEMKSVSFQLVRLEPTKS